MDSCIKGMAYTVFAVSMLVLCTHRPARASTANTNSTLIEPLAQPTNIVFGNLGSLDYMISFDAASDNPAGYLVLMRTSQSPADVPVDGSTYAVNDVIGSSTIKHIGAATSFSVTGLSAETTYYFDIFSYNGGAGTYDFLTISPLEGNRTTLASEPEFGTDVSGSSSSYSSISITFPRSNSYPFLVLMSTQNAASDIPVDGTSYNYNDVIGTSIVVIRSTGPTGSDQIFNVNDLNPATTYYFKVFSYSGTGTSSNYLQMRVTEFDLTTLTLPPVNQPTSLNLITLSLSINFSFTAAVGGADGYIMLRRTGTDPTDVPVDGTNYSVGASIGSSVVIYSGSSTEFTIGGFGQETDYHFAIFSYNGSGTAKGYLTNNPLRGNITTPSAVGVWTDITTGLEGGMNIKSFAYVGDGSTYLAIAGTTDGVFYFNGSAWSEKSNGLPPGKITSVAKSSTTGDWYAGTESSGVYKSTDAGTTWTAMNSGLTNLKVYSLCWDSSVLKLFAVTDAGVFQYAQSWSQSNGGITTPSKARTMVFVQNIGIFLGTSGEGVYKSNDGTSWVAVNSGLTNLDITALAGNQSNQVAGTSSGKVFISTNGGLSWAAYLTVESAVNCLGHNSSGSVLSGTESNGLYVATSAGTSVPGNTVRALLPFTSGPVVVGTDGLGAWVNGLGGSGSTWVTVSNGLGPPTIRDIAASGDLKIATASNGQHKYLNGQWAASGSLDATNIQLIYSDGVDLFCGTSGDIYHSEDQGGTWLPYGTGPGVSLAQAILVKGSYLFGANAGGVYRCDAPGAAWVQHTAGLSNTNITDLKTIGSKLYAATNGGGVFVSEDNGISWTGYNNGLTDLAVTSLEVTQDHVIVATPSGVFQANVTDNTFSEMNSGLVSLTVHDLEYAGSTLFAATGAGVFFSFIDDGVWRADNSGLGSSYDILRIAASSEDIFVVREDNRIWARPFSELPVEPTVQASNISVISRSENSVVLDFDGGNGASRLVLARPDNPVANQVTNGVEYDTDGSYGNPNYYWGQETYTVGKGDGTVTITNLSPNTTYHVKIFEFSGSGTEARYNNTTTSDNVATFTTLVSPPTTQASAIQRSGVAQNAITVNFTNGNGDLRILIASTDANVSLPQDGVAYTANAAFGLGSNISGDYVVGIGPGPFTVTGLSTQTTYYFKVFEFNGGGTTINYSHVASTNTLTTSTLAAEPSSQSSEVRFTSTTSSSLAISFAASDAASYLILMREGSLPPEAPVDGNSYAVNSTYNSSIVIYNGSALGFAATGLLPATEYFFKIFSYNGIDGGSNYLAEGAPSVGKSTLETEPINQATNIAFSNIQPTSLSIAWTNGSGTRRLVLASEAEPISAFADDGAEYQFDNSFEAAHEINPGNKVVFVGSNSSFNLTGLAPETQYHFKVFELDGTESQANYLPVSSTGNPSSAMTLAIEPSSPPGPITFSNATQSSVDISFESSADAVSGYIVLRRAGTPSTDAPVDGRGYESGEQNILSTVVYVGDETTFSDKLMSPGTVYHYSIYAFNGGVETYNYLATASASKFATTSPETFRFESIQFNTDKKFIPGGTISATIIGARGTPKVKIHRRKIAENAELNSEELPLRTGSTNIYDLILSADMADEMGMEFFLTAEDDIEELTQPNTGHLYLYRTLTETDIIPFEGQFNGSQRSYQMFSIPYALDNRNFEDIFDVMGAYDKTRWRLYHLADEELVEYQGGLSNLIELGKGYWFNASKNLPRSITPGTGKVYESNQETDIPLTLRAGWNQIGNPFPFVVDWLAIKEMNPDAGLNRLWYYTQTSGGSQFTAQTTFEPWKGALVFADRGGVVRFPISSSVNFNGRKKGNEISNEDPDLDIWKLQLNIAANGLGQSAAVGMHPEASESKDHFDDIALPRFFGYVQMYTLHPEFFSPRFSNDIAPTSDAREWKFKIETNEVLEKVTISWNREALAASGSSLIMIDESGQHWIDMKAAANYSISLAKGQRRSIIILYNRHGEVSPRVTILNEPYPNPVRDILKIPLLIGKDNEALEIEFFDGFGRKFQTYRREFSVRGIYEIVISENDLSKWPAGQVFYRMTSNGKSAAFQRLLKL